MLSRAPISMLVLSATAVLLLAVSTLLLDDALVVALAALGACFLCAVLVPRPEAGLMLLAAALPASSLPAVGEYGLLKVVGWGVFGAWAVNLLIGRRPIRPLLTPLTGVLTLFLGSAWHSALVTATPEAWLTFHRQLQGFGLYLVTAGLVASWRQVRGLLQWMVASGAVVIAICVALYLSGSPLVRMATAEAGGSRMEGLFAGGVNDIAKLAAVLLIVALAGPFRKGTARIGRLTIPLFAVAAVLTVSRGAFVALAAALALYFIINQQRLLGLVSGICLAGAAVLLPDIQYFTRMETIWNPIEQGWRPALYLAAWRAFSDKPLWGWGLGQSPSAMFHYHDVPRALASHNTLLEILVEQGIVGAAPILVALGILLHIWYRNLRGLGALTGDSRRSAEALTLATLAFAVSAMFLDLQVDPLLYFLIALLTTVARLNPGTLAVNRLSRLNPRLNTRSNTRTQHASGSVFAQPPLPGPGLPGTGPLHDRCQHPPQAAAAGRGLRWSRRAGFRLAGEPGARPGAF